MRLVNYFSGIIAITGAAGFIVTVVILHYLHPGHNLVHEMMGEIVFGPHGPLMQVAFLSFAVSVFGVQLGLGHIGAPAALRMLLSLAAACLLGAGNFRLNTAPELHTALISLAFVLLVLVMYLLPKNTPALGAWSNRIVSRGLATATAVSVALGGAMPSGIAQRAAAGFILLWLFWTGWRIILAEGTQRYSTMNQLLKVLMFFVMLAAIVIFYMIAFVIPNYHPGLGLLGGNPHVKVWMCGHPQYALIRERVSIKKEVEALFGRPRMLFYQKKSPGMFLEAEVEQWEYGN